MAFSIGAVKETSNGILQEIKEYVPFGAGVLAGGVITANVHTNLPSVAVGSTRFGVDDIIDVGIGFTTYMIGGSKLSLLKDVGAGIVAGWGLVKLRQLVGPSLGFYSNLEAGSNVFPSIPYQESYSTATSGYPDQGQLAPTAEVTPGTTRPGGGIYTPYNDGTGLGSPDSALSSFGGAAVDFAI